MNIIEIESKENKKIKELNKLKLKKYRAQRKEFIVENWKIIYDAFQGGIHFKEIYLTKDFLDKNKNVLKEIISDEKNFFIITENIAKKISSLDSPQGVWAVYRERKGEIDFKEDIIYLNAINDPGNLGTILRSASAFGQKNIVLDAKCVDLYNSKTIQAAKESIFKLNIISDENGEVFEKIKENNYTICVTDVEKGRDIKESFKTKEKRCIVLGSESRGVDIFLKEKATEFINIKTTSDVESLNVAISAGIIFYELF